MTERWATFLDDWRRSVFELRRKFPFEWERLELPAPEALKQLPPSPFLEQLATQFPWLDRAIIEFYATTNGWPLWLGASQTCLAPVERVGLLSKVFSRSFEVAIEFAPDARTSWSETEDASKFDLESALVLSWPESRELVLALPSLEICLYTFDNSRFFEGFDEFMLWRRRSVVNELERMLSSS